MQTGVFFGLSAALMWGVADFCARGSARTAGTFRTLLFVQIIAIPALVLLTAPFGLITLRGERWPYILGAAAVGLIILGGAGLLYRAFAIGKLALVSPIASAFAAVTALLAILTGERLAGVTLLGVILTVVGVTLASASGEPTPSSATKSDAPPERKRKRTPGLLEAIGAMGAFGVGYWLLDFIVPTLGGVATAFIAKVGDLLVLGGIALFVTWRRPHPETRLATPFWLWVVPTALLDTAANIAYNLGIATALTSVVVTLSSLFSAVTVLLAWIILRERLAPWQWVGVLTILVGVLLVNVRA
jgi:drug/metabolite transporter (DMT)-like permease